MKKFYDEQLAELGCQDNGCIIQSPTGQHTNGGCSCSRSLREAFMKNKDMDGYARIYKALARYREIVSVMASVKLIAENDAGLDLNNYFDDMDADFDAIESAMHKSSENDKTIIAQQNKDKENRRHEEILNNMWN